MLGRRIERQVSMVEGEPLHDVRSSISHIAGHRRSAVLGKARKMIEAQRRANR